MDIEKLFEALDKNEFVVAIQQSDWAFQAIETTHVLAFSLVVGTIAIVDLRLLGISGRFAPVSEVVRDYVRWTWAAFVVAAITGSLMFVTKASTYFAATPFRWKLAALAFAGINMIIFHFGVFRSVGKWDAAVEIPLAARIAAGLSLALWICIIFFGRWTGFAIVET